MEVLIFLFVLGVAVALWGWSLFSLPDVKTFWKYFLVHSLIFLTYTYIWNTYSTLITGHDEYSLARFTGYLVILICHSFIGYIVLRLELSRLKRKR